MPTDLDQVITHLQDLRRDIRGLSLQLRALQVEVATDACQNIQRAAELHERLDRIEANFRAEVATDACQDIQRAAELHERLDRIEANFRRSATNAG